MRGERGWGVHKVNENSCSEHRRTIQCNLITYLTFFISTSWKVSTGDTRVRRDYIVLQRSILVVVRWIVVSICRSLHSAYKIIRLALLYRKPLSNKRVDGLLSLPF